MWTVIFLLIQQQSSHEAWTVGQWLATKRGWDSIYIHCKYAHRRVVKYKMNAKSLWSTPCKAYAKETIVLTDIKKKTNKTFTNSGSLFLLVTGNSHSPFFPSLPQSECASSTSSCSIFHSCSSHSFHIYSLSTHRITARCLWQAVPRGIMKVKSPVSGINREVN